MSVKSKYINEVTKVALKIRPDLDKDKVKKLAASYTEQHWKDPTVILSNSVTGQTDETTFSGLCDWIDHRNPNPIVSGNATFYLQPEELESPTSGMLLALKRERKAVKKEMFKFKEDSNEYADLDLDQQNKKVIMNADYGGSGTPTAAFYTKEAPAATTLMAQSIITTMAAFFESWLGDNQKFFSINECYDWMQRVIEFKQDEKVPKWIYVPSAKETADRILKHFYILNRDDIPFIRDYIDNCSEHDRVFLYYANNYRELFSRNPATADYIANILSKLPNYELSERDIPKFMNKESDNLKFNSVNDYNNWVTAQMFLDPSKVPEQIKDDLDKLKDICTRMLYVEYITPDSIEKLNNHKRNTVLLVDTDSNIINGDLFVSYILNDIFHGYNFGRGKLYNEIILINVLAQILDIAVANTLDYYARCHNIGEEARKELSMKNEFMFRRLFLMLKKKRYAGSIVRREGKIMVPQKLEIKGMDFIKSGVSDNVSKRFTKMLDEHILNAEDIDLKGLMKDLKNFEKEIYGDLRNGGVTYLKPQMFKAENAYKDIKDKEGNVIRSQAWSLPVFRGAMVWNEIYPENKIYSLDRVNIAKLAVTDMQSLERIRYKYPDDYDRIVKGVFNSDDPRIRKAGLKVISIPAYITKLPDWIVELLDYDITISDTISSFRSVLDALHIEDFKFKTPNGDASIVSCMISL